MIKNSSSKVTNIIRFILVFALVFLVHTTSYISPALAEESSPSAEIKTKLEALKKEIASRAAQLKNEISSKLQNKAFIGTIKTKSESSFTVATLLGPKIIGFNEDTVFSVSDPAELKAKKIKRASLESLEEEDYIAALGDVDDTGVLTARKIIFIPSNQPELKQVLWGQIAAISDKLITVKDKSQNNVSISISGNTTLKNADEEIDISKLLSGDTVLISGYQNDQEVIQATYIYVLDRGASIKPKTKPATESAKIASPSAKPKIKATPKPTASAKPKTATSSGVKK